MPNLLDTLAAELERPRPLPSQVVNHLLNTYTVDRDALGAFLVKELPHLEDYEIDLILSPLFTPSLQQQAIVAELLGRDSIPASAWPGLVQQLTARPTVARFVTEDGQTHAIPLRAVSIERYVYRLRLDGTISEPVFQLLGQVTCTEDRSLLKAIARRAIWTTTPRQEILIRYLSAAPENDFHRVADAVELLKLMEIYEPADVADLLRQIPHWQRVLDQEIAEAVSPKPFFNERVQEMHGGGRDQRRQDTDRLSAKENERAFLARLLSLLGG